MRRVFEEGDMMAWIRRWLERRELKRERKYVIRNMCRVTTFESLAHLRKRLDDIDRRLGK